MTKSTDQDEMHCGCGVLIETDSEGWIVEHDCWADAHVQGCACADAYQPCDERD